MYSASCTGTLSGADCALTLTDGEFTSGQLTFAADELVSEETYTLEASGVVLLQRYGQNMNVHELCGRISWYPFVVDVLSMLTNIEPQDRALRTAGGFLASLGAQLLPATRFLISRDFLRPRLCS